MSSTHPCPSCGWTLRWAPEQASWACDRCSTVIPTQQPQPSSGLAQPYQQPVATAVGIAPAGGSFGGSAASSSPITRSPSQPPGVHQVPRVASPQAPYPQAPYANAGFGGSATAAQPPPASQFGVPVAAPPSPSGGQFAAHSGAGAPQFGAPQAGQFGGAAHSGRSNFGAGASQVGAPQAGQFGGAVQAGLSNAGAGASQYGAPQAGQFGGAAQAGLSNAVAGASQFGAPQAGQLGGGLSNAGAAASQFGATAGGQFSGAAAASQFGAGGPASHAGFGGSANAAQPPASQRGAPPFANPHTPSQPRFEQPQPGYGPGGYPSYTPPALASEVPVAKKSKRGLVIGLGAVVAVGAGIAIAVVVAKGGGSKAGLASADEVTAETLTALTAGDVDRLVMLVAPEIERDMISCDDAGAKDRDPEKSLAKLRDGFGQIAAQAKGLSVELVKLGSPKTMTLEKGKEISKGCTLSTDLAVHDHDLVVKVKSSDKPARERTFKITLTEAAGRWFLAAPPKIEQPGDCGLAVKGMLASNKAALDKAKLGDSVRARLETAGMQHCTDDAWTDQVMTCFEDAKPQNRTCAKQLTASQTEKLDKQFSAIIAEDIKSREVPVVAETPVTPPPTIDPTAPPSIDPTVAPTAGSGSGAAVVVATESASWPPICDDYKVQIDKLASCRRIKASIKKGYRDGFATMEETWTRVPRRTDAMRTSYEDICRKGIEGLVDLRKTLCR